MIKLNGKKREINTEELKRLAKKYAPNEPDFVKEVRFRLSGLEFEDLDTNGRSIEEYYFAACLNYAEENGFRQLYEEEDDGNIFAYCGTILD